MKVEMKAHVKQIVFDDKGAKVVLEVTGDGMASARAATVLAGRLAEVTVDDGQEQIPFDDTDVPKEEPLTFEVEYTAGVDVAAPAPEPKPRKKKEPKPALEGEDIPLPSEPEPVFSAGDVWEGLRLAADRHSASTEEGVTFVPAEHGIIISGCDQGDVAALGFALSMIEQREEGFFVWRASAQAALSKHKLDTAEKVHEEVMDIQDIPADEEDDDFGLDAVD